MCEKIFLDTCVISSLRGDNDPQKQAAERLISKIEQGQFKAYTSSSIIEELLETPEPAKSELMGIFDKLKERAILNEIIPDEEQMRRREILRCSYRGDEEIMKEAEDVLVVSLTDHMPGRCFRTNRKGIVLMDRDDDNIAYAVVEGCKFVTWDEHLLTDRFINTLNDINRREREAPIEFCRPSEL